MTTPTAMSALRFHLAATLAALACAAFTPAQAQQTGPMAWQVVGSDARGPVAVKTNDMFVDLPTGFAFVKTPGGWTFVGQLDAAQRARLPAGTITSLLPPDDAEPRYAQAVPSAARP